MAQLPPGIAGYELGRQADQRAQQGQMQLIGILSQLQAQQESQAQAREMRPLQLQALQGQEALRQAQIQEMQRKGAQAQQQQMAQGILANLVSTGGYQGAVAGPSSVAMTDQDAIRQVQEAESQGRQLGVNVPNPGNVQGLAIAADPQRAIPEILRQQRPPAPVNTRPLVSGPGSEGRDAQGNLLWTTPNRPSAERAERRDPLVRVMGADGKPTLVRESEAEGRTPAANPSGREDNEVIRRVLQFGSVMEKSGFPTSYATLEEATAKITPDVRKFLTGVGGLAPDFALNRQTTDARQAFQRVLNITLKDRSGAAVTVPEWERFKKEAGVGITKKPEQITEWLAQAKTILDKHYQGVAAGFPEEVRNRYFEERGRVAPFGQSAPAGSGPAVGTIQGGYRFNGGDPANPASWEKQ